MIGDYVMISKYSVVKQLKDGKYAVMSTISRSLIILEPEKYQQFCLGQEEKVFAKEEMDYLVKYKYSVTDDFEETDYLLVEMSRDRFNPRIFSTYIALSTLCNFSCVYCYEKGQLSGEAVMSEETLESTIKWYEGRLEKGKYSDFNICLYGGEPLLCEELLRSFVIKIKQLSLSKNVNLTFTMITNGYLLKRDICEFLIANGLKEVQITLDGCEDTHDKRRMLVNGEGTFNTIINNIISIADTNIKIVIRTSFDESNVEEIKRLLVYLCDKGLNKRVLLYFAPIHQTETQKISGCSFCSQHIYDDYDDIANCFCELYDASYKLGFQIPTCYTNGPCMVVGQDSCLIAPNGDLFKCVEMIGKEELCIGNVRQDDYKGKYYSFMKADQFLNCVRSGCKYAPTCAGGCAMEAYVKNDNLNSFVCHRSIFEKLNDKLISLKCEEE